MYPYTIQKLINLFSKFPTVGPRTAARFVFYLIKLPKEKIDEFVKSLQDLKNQIKFCFFCFNPFIASEKASIERFSPEFTAGLSRTSSAQRDEKKLCPICRNNSRDRTMLCVIEKESDLISIEKTKKYEGLYFILGGTISNLKEDDIKKLKIRELEKRIKNPENFGLPSANFKEIIIATNPTTEGEATTLLIERRLKSSPLSEIKITRLARGLPKGGELEYADEETLGSAFEGRK